MLKEELGSPPEDLTTVTVGEFGDGDRGILAEDFEVDHSHVKKGENVLESSFRDVQNGFSTLLGLNFRVDPDFDCGDRDSLGHFFDEDLHGSLHSYIVYHISRY